MRKQRNYISKRWPKRQARLHVLSSSSTRGVIALGGMCFPVAIGRGLRELKMEGDGCTPMGTFRLLRVLHRPDRVRRPTGNLPIRAIRPLDGWCDAAGDRNYNRPVPLPYPASHERLWRQDRLYDIVVVLDCNIEPRCRGRGSAIFMHIARRNLAPTAGCIAMTREDLLRFLAAAPKSVSTPNARLTRSLAVPIAKTRSCQPYRGRRGLR